ncbi:alpha/beta hydrolase [Viridibacillus sp. YIM B01967]|uniref:Alpha/beta hydrolase n=1 Tax=Viridibacillus soli TaxID=2798301 RepID=A0ABS1H346_9BACL|nr:alpha/beta hydrolase [Viridibacillus soli]MBK3493839.1 alpha/beta hydrolase [Viridibacillus soli]
MALTPKVKLLLEQLEKSGTPEIHELSPVEARSYFTIEDLAGKRVELESVINQTLHTNVGEVPVRIYTPIKSSEALPVFVYYHGGGWVIGNLDTADIPCRQIAAESKSVVVSVDYRLAPESKFPAAIDDSYAVIEWLIDNAEKLNIDATRIAVGGDSAGGNIAAVVSLKARNHGVNSIIQQVLLYPVTDYNLNTDSYLDFAEGYFLTKETMQWFWNHYLRDESDGENPDVSPLKATDLTNLPPALIITAEYDPLRDEGEAYAKKLQEANIPVQLKRYDGVIHGFFSMAGLLEEGADAIKLVSTTLSKAFHNTSKDSLIK